MSGTKFRGPAVRILDTPLKSISEFEHFKHSVLFHLRQDEDFKPLLKANLDFGTKTTLLPNRNFLSDTKAPNKTAEEKCEECDFLLDTIAQYCPLIPHIDITSCGSLNEVWKVIRLHNNLEVSGALLNDVFNITKSPDETPQALWSRLKQQYDDCLIRRNTLIYKDAQLDADEVMSPTLHNVIILHWLQLLHPKLRDHVTQKFSKEIRNASYASIWSEICRSIDTFLRDLSDDESSVRRFDPVNFNNTSTSSYNPPRYSSQNRRPWRARGSDSRFPGAQSNRPHATKKCDYCRLTGRRAWFNHTIEECLFLKKERPATSNSVEVDEEYDEHYVEFVEAYPASLPDESQSVNHVINRISVSASPVLPLYIDNKKYRVTLDTGGTCNVLDANTAADLKCKINPTNQRARMADSQTHLNVLGETDIIFSRDSRVFKLSALVCDIKEPTILAGMPFMIRHDVAVRPAKSEIILDGVESIKYNPKQIQQSVSRRVSSYTIRSAEKSVILPGESTTLQVPQDLSLNNTVAVEPRFDNSYQKYLSDPWPCPRVYAVKDGEITVTNNSDIAISVKKNQHLCNVHFEIPESDVQIAMKSYQSVVQPDQSQVQSIHSGVPVKASLHNSVNSKPTPYATTSKIPVPVSNMSKLVPKKTVPYSMPVVLNPDSILSSEVASRFASLLTEYDSVFNPAISQYNQKSGVCYVHINMGPNPPPQQKGRVPVFYGRNDLVQLQEKFDVLVEKGVFKRPQDLGVAVENLNTTFLVKKKDSEEKRLVTDFATITGYCRPTPSLMPDVDSTLRQISSWKYIIKSDLKEAYYQIPLTKSSMKYAGVCSPMKGVFVYTVGCMGLPGTEVALEELTNMLFGHMVMRGHVAKLADDLFIGANTVEELLSNFEEVLGILLENNLKLNAKKTFIVPKSVTILGWEWESGMLKASSHKLSALSECEPPKTAKALRSYIGAYRFLSRVLQNYASVLLPLEDMLPGKYHKQTAGNMKIVWSAEQMEAFKKAQLTLKSAKVITLPQPSDILQIVTDAAVQPSAIGATLYILRGKKVLLGGFFNAKLPPFQRRWLPCELEGVGIGISLQHFAPYIMQSEHRPVVLTDSKACVDAVEKLMRGEFSASARLCTFLSSVSRYRAIVKHIQGNTNIVSDYISRNPTDCSNSRCQVCSFIRDAIDSVVSTVSVSDVMEGRVQLPFVNQKAWIEIQMECQDLRNVMKYLQNGTHPGKKGRNLRLVKQYIRSKVIISHVGALVVRQIEPFLPQMERIVVPQAVLHGILTVLHIRLNHPSTSQLMKVFNRSFMALKLEPATAQVTRSCHHCNSLKEIPKSLKEESTGEPPEHLAEKFAADVMKRNSQVILVLRECVSSYTQAELIANETVEELSAGLLRLSNLVRPSKFTEMTIRLDPHPSHRSMFNTIKKDRGLAAQNIQIDLGREMNPNKNPIAEKAVKELIREILNVAPEGGKISATCLSQAVANLNCRVRAPGVSAHELYTKRDQTTGDQLSLDDLKVIKEQLTRRNANHKYSEQSKSGGKPSNPAAKVNVGSIIYLYSDGSKLNARKRYVVLSVNKEWCKVRRLADRRLGLISYDVKITECYIVPDELEDVTLPALEDEDSDCLDEFISKPKLPAHDVAGEIQEEFSSDEDLDVDSDSGTEEVETTSYCSVCHREVKEDHQSLLCDRCTKWSHRNCVGMKKKSYRELMKEDNFNWSCPSCPNQDDVEQEDEPPDLPLLVDLQ